MYSNLQRILTDLRSHVSGNATFIVALGMPALIGAAGLAVDTAQWYLWKNEVQHSVDQAALSGAFALTSTASKDNYQTRALQEFNTNQQVTTSFTTAPSISLADYAGGDDNSVLVSATASKFLPFSGFLTGAAASIVVSAQASYTAGANYHACLVATDEEGTSIDIGGNATVKAQCGLAALSCDVDAVTIDGSATVLTDSIATCGTASVPESNESVVVENVTGLTDIYKNLTPPDNQTPRSYNCESVGTGANKTKIASLQPGTYSGGITAKCTTVFAPGIYVVDGGLLDLSANYNVTGNNVMFVLKNGAKIKFGGEGNDNRISLSPMQASDFVGTEYQDRADDYSGMLVFEARDNASSSTGHVLNGNSNSLIEGTIYLPANGITILGTADVSSECLQISAKTIEIGGGAFLETLCPVADTMSAGSSTATVRLVR